MPLPLKKLTGPEPVPTPQAAQMAGYQQPAPALRASSNPFKKAGDWFEENVTQPIAKFAKDPVGQAGEAVSTVVQPFKDAGQAIDKAITRPITNAVGLTDAPIDPQTKAQLDPEKVKTMADYGNMIKTQAGTYDPAKYGEGYFKSGEYKPQTTPNAQQMPGAYQAGTPTAKLPTTAQVQAPQSGAVAAPKVPTANTQQAPEIPAAQQVPYTAGVMQAPSMQNVQYLNPNIQASNTTANLSESQAALSNQLKQLQTSQQLTAGYDQNMRDTSVAMATSGLQQQKDAAMAQLKEQQMAAGNYGSSVGQKAMMDLQQNYDRQVSEAGMASDLRQNEAAREDRYRNIGVDQTNTGLITNVAGAASNTELAGKGFEQNTGQINNAAEALKADYARQGIQIDNATAIQMAGFTADQRQSDFSNRVISAGLQSGENQTQYQNQVNAANTSNQAQQQQFINEMTAKGMTIEEAQREFQNQMTAGNFNAGQNQQTFQNQQQIDAVTNAQKMAEYTAGMERYGIGANEAAATSATANQAQLYNLGQQGADQSANYGAYQDSLKNMAGYAGNQLNPQSVIDAEAYQKQQEEKQRRIQQTIDIAAKAALGA